MKKILLTGLSLGMFSIGIMAGNAMAVPVGNGSEASLQKVLDNITVNPSTGTDPNNIFPSSVDVATDYVASEIDDYWAIGGSGTSSATLVIELAGNAGSNYFGIYDHSDSSKRVTLFDGADSPGSFPGFTTTVSLLEDGSVILNSNQDTGITFAANNFGFFLGTLNQGIFFSDTLLNMDHFDHMFAYEGTGDKVKLAGLPAGIWSSNEYILGWEDLNGGGDGDYNDFVVMVESVNPVPEPASILLFGAGLAGLAGIVTKRRKNEEMYLS